MLAEAGAAARREQLPPGDRARAPSSAKQRQRGVRRVRQGRRALRAKVRDARRRTSRPPTRLRAVVLRRPRRVRPRPDRPRRRLPDSASRALIRAAILALPGEPAEKHLRQVRQRSVHPDERLKPAVKFRYLKGGFEIVGDHKQAHEARRCTTITRTWSPRSSSTPRRRLDARRPRRAVRRVRQPASTPARSSASPAGSAGTSRTRTGNTCSPTTTAGRWRTTATSSRRPRTAALKEHFEVLSVTFQDEKVNSRATAEYGWRVTPYAYILLKPRGPAGRQDPAAAAGPRLPRHVGLRDPAGRVAGACRSTRRRRRRRPGPSRSSRSRRRSTSGRPKEGKLILEVKAVGAGPRSAARQTGRPESAPISRSARSTTSGVSVSRFDPESSEPVVVSERTWMVTYRSEDLAAFPRRSRSPGPRPKRTNRTAATTTPISTKSNRRSRWRSSTANVPAGPGRCGRHPDRGSGPPWQ